MISFKYKPKLLIIGIFFVISVHTELDITKTEFIQCVQVYGFYCKFPENTYELFAEKVQQIGGISTKLEALMAIAQLSWESAGFTAKASWLCTQAYEVKEYWQNADYKLCLTYDKKGCPQNNWYYGRGYAQITQCYNYRNASMDLYGNDILVERPELVATNDSIAMETAIWLWKNKIHNYPGVSDGQFGATTMALVGRLECGNVTETAKKRWERFKKCIEVVNYNGNDYSESGCYPVDTDSSAKVKNNLLVAIIGCAIILIIITIVTYVSIKYYKLKNKLIVAQTSKDTCNTDFYMEVIGKNAKNNEYTSIP